MEKNIVVITSCSKKKNPSEQIARNLYSGQFFKGVCEFCEYRKYDLYILSAKYGLIPSNQIIENYDQRIETKSDIQRLKLKIGEFSSFFQRYDYILLLMGRKYRSVFEEFLKNPKIIIADDSRGIGGYNQLIHLLNEKKSSKFEELFNHETKIMNINTILHI